MAVDLMEPFEQMRLLMVDKGIDQAHQGMVRSAYLLGLAAGARLAYSAPEPEVTQALLQANARLEAEAVSMRMGTHGHG